MDVVTQSVGELKAICSRPRHALQQVINLGYVVFTALMFWKLLMLATGTPSPVVVVLSGSMEPGFYRGDLMLLTKPPQITAGDVVVFQIHGRDIPIVHRALSMHQDAKNESAYHLLTKGDNNDIDDRGLYATGQLWLEPTNTLGVARGSAPYIGMMTIWLNDYPWLKYCAIGFMAMLVILGKD